MERLDRWIGWLLLIALYQVNGDKLRILKVQMADLPKAGMDGGTWRILAFGGGRFSARICSLEQCCQTGYLNTDDDNWERAEVNFFVGSQLGGCENLALENESVTLTLQHKGSDGGHVESMTLLGSTPSKASFICRIDRKLDHDDFYTSECVKSDHDFPESHCNGHPGFCGLKFNEFTFCGSHNAGTGEADSLTNCVLKNHDLTILEQLDFGMRFFDFDIIYSHTLPRCDGLETGHGKMPSLGLYVCFGSVVKVFRDVRHWMVEHPREVVTLYFGELHYEDETFGHLLEALKLQFGQSDSPIQMNTQFKAEGTWPTLGQAIEANQRLFVFIRSAMVPAHELGMVQEVQVSQRDPSPAVIAGSVRILSTFGSRGIDDQCSEVIETNREACSLSSELTKTAVFATFLRSGADCVWEIARKCNPRVPEAVQACLESKANVNFVQVDFPNYPAGSRVQLVDYIHQLNLNKLD